MLFIIGGARSGKSTYAETRIKEMQSNLGEVIYIATAISMDGDMANRIQRHKAVRPKEWHTIELYKNFSQLVEDEKFRNSTTILVDCITVMITNLMFEQYNDLDFETITDDQISTMEEIIKGEIIQLIDICQRYSKKLVVVSNEVGYGLVPSYRLGRIFRDIAGRMNQMIASKATEVVLVTAGIPLRIK